MLGAGRLNVIESFIGGVIDIVLHVVCYRIGEAVLRTVFVGHLTPQFFDKYTYLTIAVGGIVVIVFATSFWLVLS